MGKYEQLATRTEIVCEKANEIRKDAISARAKARSEKELRIINSTEQGLIQRICRENRVSLEIVNQIVYIDNSLGDDEFC